MEKRSLYDADAVADIRRRIGRLTADSKPEWGSMSVGQMLAHCAEVQDVVNGKSLEGTPFLVRLIGPLIRRMVLSHKPYPRGAKTHPQYEQSEPRDFDEQRQRLLAAIETFLGGGVANPARHPLFGPMTREEKGWSAYKHLDHHLTQFGV